MSGERRSAQVRRGWLSAAAYAGMFSFGVVMALLGAILPIVSERLHLNLAQAGNLFLMMNAAMLVTTLAIGPMLDRFSHKGPLLVAPFFIAGALVLLSTVRDTGALDTAVVLLGIGGGAVNQTTNTLIADLYEEAHRKSVALNILGVFFGFGALFLPFAIGSLLRSAGLTSILYLAALLTLGPVALSLPFSFPAARQRGGVPFAEIGKLLREPLILILSALLFFESGNEFILGGYVSLYATHELAITVSKASYLLASYWAALMAGRLLLSRTIFHKGGGPLIAASALAVAGSTILLLTSRSSGLASAAVVLLGLSIATIFPTVLGLAGSCYPTHSGTVFGILIGISLSGGMTLPWITGKFSESFGIRRGLLIVVIDSLTIFGLQLIANRAMSGRRA